MTKAKFSLFLLSASIAVIYFFTMVQWENSKDVRQDNQTVNAAIDELKALTAKQNEIADQYNSIRASLLEKVATAIPFGPQASTLLSDLEAIATRNGVLLSGVDFGTTSGRGAQLAIQGGTQTLPITIHAAGTYDTFRRFIRDLELNQRIIDVVGINFGVNATQSTIFEFTLQAKAYYQ